MTLNAEKRHSQKRGIHTQVRASVDLKHRCSMRKTVRDGVNPHEDSESEQEREPYGGNHSVAVDHSVGSGRRRVGFLLGVGLSPPLALAISKHKTLSSCTTRRDRLVRPTEFAKHLRYHESRIFVKHWRCRVRPTRSEPLKIRHLAIPKLLAKICINPFPEGAVWILQSVLSANNPFASKLQMPTKTEEPFTRIVISSALWHCSKVEAKKRRIIHQRSLRTVSVGVNTPRSLTG